MKSDSSPERDHAHDDDVTKEPEVTDGNKKRKRKPYRPGEAGQEQAVTPLTSSLPVSVSLCLPVSMCLRYRGLHGASAWREGRAEQNQTVQERLNRDADGSR